MADITDQELQAEIMALANHLHQCVPDGTRGVVVLMALAILIGAGLNYGPPSQKVGQRKLVDDTINEIVEGRIQVVFEP